MNDKRKNKLNHDLELKLKNDCLILSEVIPNLLQMDYKKNIKQYKLSDYKTIIFHYKSTFQILN
jgi:hypothetical protein